MNILSDNLDIKLTLGQFYNIFHSGVFPLPDVAIYAINEIELGSNYRFRTKQIKNAINNSLNTKFKVKRISCGSNSWQFRVSCRTGRYWNTIYEFWIDRDMSFTVRFN